MVSHKGINSFRHTVFILPSNPLPLSIYIPSSPQVPFFSPSPSLAPWKAHFIYWLMTFDSCFQCYWICDLDMQLYHLSTPIVYHISLLSAPCFFLIFFIPSSITFLFYPLPCTFGSKGQRCFRYIPRVELSCF